MEHGLAYIRLKFKLSYTFKFQNVLHCGVVGRVSGLGGGWSGVQIPVGKTKFSLPQNVRIGFGDHTTSC
jgi:hypothetical protein